MSIKLTQLLMTIPCVIYWKDKNGIYLGCNEFMAKICGLSSAKEVIGKTDNDLSWAQSADILRKNDQEVMASGQAITIEETGKLVDGKLATYLSTKIPLLNNENRIIGIFGISMDISAQKYKEHTLSSQRINAEEQTKLASVYLQNILANLPEPIYWVDKEGVILGCNDSEAHMFGFKNASEIIGKGVYDLARKMGWDEDITQAFRKNDLEIMQSGKGKAVEESALLNGIPRTFVSHKKPLLNDKGKVIGIIGTSIDITESKKIQLELEKAKQKAELASQSKSNFLGVISHELRTPLNAIIGMAQILDRKKLDEDQRECVDIIMESGKNLLAMINDILNFSQLEAGKLRIKLNGFDVHELVEEVEISSLPQMNDKPIKLITNYDQNVPKMLIGDALRIKQIITNLINNAIKFTEKGHIKLNIGFETASLEKGTLIVSVEDTGIGIPEDKLDSIFERFSQVDTSYSRRYGSVGLGLTICKQLLDVMGGEIHVQSAPNKGSKFWFTLPLSLPTKIKGENYQAAQDLQFDQIKFKQSPQILLVEDNLLNQKVLKIMLEEMGCHLDIANEGNQALTMYQQKPYDLIFMDVGLPDMDGLYVTSTIRKLEKSKSRIPVINITAHVFKEDIDNCLKAGADEIISKPVMRDELVKILRKWLSKLT